MPERVYIGLGSNLGERAENLRKALETLEEGRDVEVVASSSFIETEPLGGGEQGRYLNAAAELVTALEPRQLLERLAEVERKLGRQRRREKWAPRTVDLDLLLYGDAVIDEPDFKVPHEQMHLRSFVLGPLSEIAADAVHPVTGRTVRELAERLGGRDFFKDAGRPQLVCVAGVIGVGKTTLAANLAQELDCALLREAYDTNPFLAKVYGGEHAYALDSQLYFLMSRVRQLSREELAAGEAAVSDYVFDKELVYARRLLDGEQLRLYMDIHMSVAAGAAEPVLTVYLHDTLEHCMERIRRRGREYEQRIGEGFLETLAGDYDKMFSTWASSPLIRVDAGVFDCRQRSDVRRLANEIKVYLAG